MAKLSFVIVGTGNIGSKYSRILKSLHDAELVAAVDIDFSKRKRIESLVPFFTSLEDFLAAKIPADVICICTPNGLHAAHTIACLQAGYHVVCEKPIALNTEDVYDMMVAEKASCKKVFAVMQNRYSPVAMWLKKLVEKNMLGDLLYLQINCFWNRNQQYYDDSPWRVTKKLGGGPLFTQFSHFIDLMLWLTGQPSQVKGESFSLNKAIKTEFDDSGCIQFNMESGGKGIFNYTNAAWNSNIESSLTIIGSKGNVKVGGQYMEKLEYVHLENSFEVPIFDQITHANQYSYYQGSADKHDVFLQKVISCIREDKKPEIGLEDELNVINFIEQAIACLQSKSY